MIVLGKQINIKSIVRVLLVVLASAWFIPISCTLPLLLHDEPFMAGGEVPITDNFDYRNFTIVTISDDMDERFVSIPYKNIKTTNSFNFLMPKSEDNKTGKPFKFGDWEGMIHPFISYEIIEQDAQGQIIEVVEKVDIPHSYTIYKSRYRVENNNITPISFKIYHESMGGTGYIFVVFIQAIFVYLFFKLFLYLFFTRNEDKNTKSENIETNNTSTYCWKGIVNGENQEGKILARSKEDATNQLKDKKVIITQLKLGRREYYWEAIVDGKKQEGEIYAESEHDVIIALWDKKIFNPKVVLIKGSQNNSIGLQSKPANKNTSFIRKVFLSFGIVLFISASIIIALTIVGVPMYQGFVAQAKVNASKENHTRFNALTSMLSTRCSTGLKEIILPVNTTPFTCPDTADKFIDNLILHTRSNGWKNPYDPTQNCCSKSPKNPPLSGAPNTHIYATSDNQITIKTNIGTEDGDNKWLIKKIVRAKHK